MKFKLQKHERINKFNILPKSKESVQSSFKSIVDSRCRLQLDVKIGTVKILTLYRIRYTS